MDPDIFRFSLTVEITMVVRLLVAALVGGLIGYERRHAAKPAGIRTMALVSLGACGFTLVSIYGFEGFGTGWDPARVAAQVATGVGFIGAGTMMRSGTVVRGLTTATGIWVAAALGMAAGAGLYVLAVVGAVLSAGVMHFLPRRPDLDDEGEQS